MKETAIKVITKDKMKSNKIIELHNLHPDWPAWKIAEQVGVSDIKVQRVRKGINLQKHYQNL